MARPRVGVIGAGNVGATVAREVAAAGIADVALVDIVEGLAKGKALDLAQSLALGGSSSGISGGTEYSLLDGCAAVVVTAGIPRKPGMSRDDLLATNAGIVKAAAEEIRKRAPGAAVVVVTNPLDVMTYLAWRVTGFPAARVAGMAGVLDSARFAHFVSAELKVSASDVRAMVLGGHGDDMVPLPGHTTVDGIPLPELLSADAIAKLADRTRGGGAEIVSYLKTGSAFYAPGAAAALMVSCILRDEKRMLPASAVLDGQYDERDLCLGVPVVLGAGGVERIVELPLTPGARASLKKSADSVRAGIKVLRERGFA